MDNKVNKGGRKAIKLDEREIERLSGLGLNEKQIADNLGVSWRTFHRKKNQKSVLAAISRGRSKALKNVSNSLYEQATKPEPNIHATKFFLSNRGEHGQWAERDLSLNVDLNLNNILKEARQRLEPITNPIKIIDNETHKIQDKQSKGGLPKKKHDSKNEPDDHLQCKNETEPF